MENKNYGMTVLIAILFLIVGGVSTYFIMNNSNDKESVGNNQQDNNVSNNNNKDEKWTDYILNSDIKSIELTYCDENKLVDVDDGPVSKTISINENDLNEIFDEIKKGKLIKHYGGGFGSGCPYGLAIKYIRNSDEYEFNLDFYTVMRDIEDKELLNLVAKSEYEITKTESDGYEYTEDDATYVLDFNVDVFDKYIK